jgi:hypothetical protein
MTGCRHWQQAACTLAAICVWGTDSVVNAAPVLRSADVAITMSGRASCEVTMALEVDGGTAIDHRLEAVEGTRVDRLEVQGAEPIGESKMIGRTHSLVLQLERPAYTLRYRVHQDQGGRSRCPLWLPGVPTDGVSKAVRIQVELPPGTSPRASMPSFTWKGTSGTTTLGHLPAFVLLPYALPGEPQGWDIATAVDAAAVAAFVGASAIWLWRRRR